MNNFIHIFCRFFHHNVWQDKNLMVVIILLFSPPPPVEPDPAIITFNHMEPVREGLNIQLSCSATLRGDITYSWTKDNAPLPSDTRFDENPTQGYLRITMVTVESEGVYVCTARNAENTMTSSAPYTLQVQRVQRK